MNYQKVYMNHIHSSSMLCQLAQMWRSQLLCDALICTGNVVTKAHRVVLLAACPMLQSMENASIGTELEVRLAADIKQDAVTTFLQYLYEGFMMLTEENVKHVEKVARLLQVDSVIKCCSDFFKCLEKSTGKPHNGNYKFDKYDLLEFRHVRATGLQKTYHERLMKRTSESPKPSSPSGGKRQRLHPRPSTPPSDNYSSQRADDAASMAQSYMSGIPTDNRTGSVRSGASSQSSRSGSPSVVEIIEDSLELIQREKPGPGQPEPPSGRLAQQKTSISIASHVSNTKDTRVVSIADDSGGGRTRVTDSFSDRVQNIPNSPQQSSQVQMPVSPKISFRDSHPSIQHPSPTSFLPRVPQNQISFTSQPPPPPLQQAGTLNIAPLAQTFSQERFQPRLQEPQSSQPRPPPQLSTDMFMSDNAMIKTSQSFMTSTPQRSHPTFPPSSGAKPSFAVGSASQAGMPSQSPSFLSQTSSQQQDTSQMIVDKEKREVESSRPQEGHDPGPSDNQSDTPDLAIVKIEKVGEDETGGLLLQVDSGQGDAASQMQRLGQFSVEEEQEYDESDLTGDWSQEDMSNEGSSQMEDPTGGGAMYMGPTSDKCHGGSRTSLESIFYRTSAHNDDDDDDNNKGFLVSDGEQVELHPNTGVYCSLTNINKICAVSSKEPSKMIRCLLEMFFDDQYLAGHCAKGRLPFGCKDPSDSRPAIDSVILGAIKGFVCGRFPNVTESTFHQLVNSKCSDSRKRCKRQFRHQQSFQLFPVFK